MLGRLLIIFFILIALIHGLGLAQSWYWSYLWLDTVMHLLGGGWLSLLFFYLFEKRWRIFDLKKSFSATLILALGFVSFAAVLWEFYEYSYDNFIAGIPESIPRPHPSLYADTLKDFMNALIGGMFVFFVYWFYFKKLSSPVNKVP